MSSEHLASAQNVLKGNLAGAWDILSGSQGEYTDLGIARRFGGSAAAYSLRDIGAMNGRVVKVRRSSDGDERDFSAGAIASGGLESYATETVNMYTSNFATTDGFLDQQGTVASADGIGGKDDVLGFTLNTATSSFHMAFKNIATSDETVRVQGEIYIPSSNNKVDSVAIFIDGNGSSTQIGSTLVPTADQWVAFDVTGQVSGAKIHFRAKDGGTFTITDSGGDDVFYLANVTVNATQSSGYVKTWYDQSGNGNDATQSSATSQPKIIENGSVLTQDGNPTLAFDGEASTGDHLTITKPSQLSTDMSFLTVINFIDPDGKDNVQDVFISQSGTRWWLYAQNTAAGYTIRSNSNTGQNAVAVGSQPINTQRLFTVIRNNSSDSAQLRVNGSLEDDNTSGMTLSITSADFTLGRLGSGNRHAYANAQEVIFFGRAIESDASELETDINNYYNIYS